MISSLTRLNACRLPRAICAITISPSTTAICQCPAAFASTTSTLTQHTRLAHTNIIKLASQPPQPPAASGLETSSAPIKLKVERNSKFSTVRQYLTDADRAHFLSIVGTDGFVTDPTQLQLYNTDWMRKFHGHSSLVLRPKTSAEVSAILAYCNSRSLAVVPQGGNTGLVGGSVPVFDEVILSFSRMNQILAFDEFSGIVTCESGVILEVLNAYLEERGFTMPLDLGAKGSCHVGGNVSTNAGGLRYVRYGSLHGSVLGMEMVLANGTIVDSLTTLRKDNTGYDLKQLFIGAEGTLGAITKLSILAARKPKSQLVAVLGCASYEHVLQTMQQARAELLEIVSAVEFWDRGSLDLVLKHLPNSRDPLPSSHPFYMLLETSGASESHDLEKLNGFLEKALERGVIMDGTVAQDTTQARALWRLRETITEGLAKEGTVYKYDISLPVSTMYAMVEKTAARLKGKVGGVVGYGHLGDGNLHLNVHTPKYSAEVLALIEPWLFEQTALERGSVSAEHGLGLSKAEYIGMSKSPEMVQLMRQVKELFDPKGILNPYKVLPKQK